MIYDLESIRKSYESGQTYKYVFFWGHTQRADGKVDASCFSQWFPSCFEIGGVVYSCAEQYMMAEKARMFGDSAMLEAIMASKHPKEMKEFGRAVQSIDKTAWDNSCYAIVRDGNIAKFSQNPDFWAVLAATENHILVEASPRDRIWGIGMGKDNPNAENPLNWRGRNLLGFALTEARDMILERGKHEQERNRKANHRDCQSGLL